jgi:hypothetical protein
VGWGPKLGCVTLLLLVLLLLLLVVVVVVVVEEEEEEETYRMNFLPPLPPNVYDIP